MNEATISVFQSIKFFAFLHTISHEAGTRELLKRSTSVE